MARRIKSLHHNLENKNVVFHQEHRSKKNRKPNGRYQRKLAVAKKKKIELLRLKELELDI